MLWIRQKQCEFKGFSRRKEQSPFPTVRIGKLYGFPQHCTILQTYSDGASGKPRPTKGTKIFTFVRSRSKDGSFWRFETLGDSHASVRAGSE